MAALEDIYRGIPEEFKGQSPTRLAKGVVDAYFTGVDSAYKHVNLPKEAVQCIGLVPGFSEGQFSLEVSPDRMGRPENRRTHILAASSDRSHVFEAEINQLSGLVDTHFRGRSPSLGENVEYCVTSYVWRTLTDFIMEHAEAGAFVPVESEHILFA